MFRLYTAAVAAVIAMTLSAGAYAGNQNCSLGNCNSNVANGGAGGQGGVGGQGGAGGTGIGVGIGGGATANQAQGQQQGQIQGQLQGQLQGQGQISNAVNRGNAFSSSTSVDASTRVDAEPAYAPNVTLTSSNCIGSVSGSGGGGGVVSIGLGMTISYDDCFKMEAAKIYISMGQPRKAEQVLQSIDFIKDAMKPETAVLPATTNQISMLPDGDVITWNSPRFALKE